jgi:predicted TIM-barrel enzyme
MDRYKTVFRKKHTLLVVVHAHSEEHALRNVKVARENGADGVFLINHILDADELVRCYLAVREVHPTWWIGINFLDLRPNEALDILPNDADGFWADSTYRARSMQEGMFETRMRTKRESWRGLYFGGVAFKGQPYEPDQRKAAKDAVVTMDVITTSGKGTGIPPDVDKLKRIREGAGMHPVAVASGTSADNVTEFMPYVDCFLVATSLERPKDELYPKHVRAFADRIKSKK